MQGKKNCDVRCANVCVKTELYGSGVLPRVAYGSETWGMKKQRSQKHDALEMRCLGNICGLTRLGNVGNGKVKCRDEKF